MKPELVAPAGDFEALKAAIHNGADAVYLGGKKFNARLYAKNFQLEELEYAVKYAHDWDVKVYVTVNTLVSDKELRELGAYIIDLYALEADAIIIQDLGVLKLCRELLPDFKIHASTQMTVHNGETVKFLNNLCVKRVILARELSLKEIRQIKEECNVEIEVFIHGALCFSLSGQCLMSSFLGGRSANRGRCASPCRLPYSIVDKKGHHLHTRGPHILSMKDLNLSEDIGKLIDTQVDALKIEGRIKSPEYVAVVTSIYRKLIDQQRKPTPTEKQELKAIFNRGFTRGYLYGNPGYKAISYERPDNQGILVGTVTGYDSKSRTATILLSGDIRLGDGLEFETATGKKGLSCNILFVNGKPIREAFPSCTVNISLPFRPISNSYVRKTRDATLHSRAQATYSTTAQKIKSFITADSDVSIGKKLLEKKLDTVLSPSKTKRTFSKPRISIELSTLEAMNEAIKTKVDVIYFGGFCQFQGLEYYEQALNIAKENGKSLTVMLPRIMKDRGQLRSKIRGLTDAGADSFLAGDLGTLELLRQMGLKTYLDSSFNIFNSLTCNILSNYTSRMTLCNELDISQIRYIAEQWNKEVEYIVQGPVTLMVSKRCPISDAVNTGNKLTCRKVCSGSEFFLKDRKGILFPIYCDENSYANILNSVDICLVDYLPELKTAGVNIFRIRGQYYTPRILGELVKCYRAALQIDIYNQEGMQVLYSLKKKIRTLSARRISKGKLFDGV